MGPHCGIADLGGLIDLKAEARTLDGPLLSVAESPRHLYAGDLWDAPRGPVGAVPVGVATRRPVVCVAAAIFAPAVDPWALLCVAIWVGVLHRGGPVCRGLTDRRCYNSHNR